MEEKILKELEEIKKELQDIRSILEPKELKILIDTNEIINKTHSALNQLSKGEKTINQIRSEYGLNPINNEAFNSKYKVDLLNKHLNEVSDWLRESAIDPESNLGREMLKQTKEIITQHYEIREIKRRLDQLNN